MDQIRVLCVDDDPKVLGGSRDARPSNQQVSGTLGQHQKLVCRKKGLDK
jgi:hypothetical protein